MNSHHRTILELIRKGSGKPTQHTFLNNYLGNDHPRYPISMPALRSIAKEWMKSHPKLSSGNLTALLTSLVKGESSTEKCFAGILLGYARKEQRGIDPSCFDRWLDHLTGWAEIDTLCTGKHFAKDIPANWASWKKLLVELSKSENIGKRRASIVLFCSPLSQVKDDRLVQMALKNVDRLKSERDGLITKAISWILRSMVKHYPVTVSEYVDKNRQTLPKIAIRETLIKLETGKKIRRQS